VDTETKYLSISGPNFMFWVVIVLKISSVEVGFVTSLEIQTSYIFYFRFKQILVKFQTL
jgi:hypothetical protein